MKYAFFLGCLIPAREFSYEVSVRKLMPLFGVELVDMENANCCAPFSIQSIDHASWLALAARNLCIAEEMGLNIFTLCNDCYESLLMTNTLLKENRELREEVNSILAVVDKEFKGKIEVKNLVDVLHDDIGVEKVKKAVKNPLHGLNVGVQPGCHLTKPKRLHFGETIGVHSLDELVEATGAKSINFERKETCCGGPLRGVNDEIALQVAKQKLDSLKNAGVDSIVTVCPFCYLELDLGQLEIKRHLNAEYNIPVIHFAELLRIAVGMPLEDWEIRSHKIPLTKVLEKIKEG
jgi:heterodisulfide reductase subunit B